MPARLVALDRAVELPAPLVSLPRHSATPPGSVSGTDAMLARAAPSLRSLQIVRVLAADRELDDRRARLDRRAREREAELGRLDEQPRGAAACAGAASAREQRDAGRGASLEDHRLPDAARVGQDGGGIDAEPVAAQRAVERRGSPTVARRLPAASSLSTPGNSPIIRPAARVPIRKPTPAAPWSVPEPFSSARRPNSDHTSMSTRSASPRASRSRWKASSESNVSCRFLRQRLRLVGVRVVGAGRAHGGGADGQAGGEHRGEAGEPLRERVGGLRVGGGGRVGGLAVLAERRERVAHVAGERGGARGLRHRGVARAGSARPMRVNAGTARSSAGPHAPGVQKPKSSGLPIGGDRVAGGGQRRARAGRRATRPGAGCRRRRRGRARGRASRCAGAASSAPTSQKWREVKCDWSAPV